MHKANLGMSMMIGQWVCGRASAIITHPIANMRNAKGKDTKKLAGVRTLKERALLTLNEDFRERIIL